MYLASGSRRGEILRFPLVVGCARDVWEFNKALLDYLITLALECIGESLGDGQGELKAEAPSSA